MRGGKERRGRGEGKVGRGSELGEMKERKDHLLVLHEPHLLYSVDALHVKHFRCMMQLNYTMKYSQNCYIKCVCIFSNILLSALTSTPPSVCMFI